MPSDTELQQLIIYVGTQEKVNQARQQGTITENDFVVVTDAPEYALQSSVQAIQVLIPNGASVDNLLASESFVNSSINNMAAFYDTADAQGNPFATKAALIAGPWYNKGELRTPTTNDYALVSEDETHDDATSRFMYDGTQWVWQYTLNNTKFTQAQIDAINSTITKALVDQITTNQNNIGDLTTLQTSTKTSTVAAINELQNGKQATISDLATIRSNATAGKQASDTIATYGNIVTHNVSEFATSAQGTKADSALQGVQINGTDLTPDTDNKVNIPKASVNDLGVVKTNQSYGIASANDGLVYVYNADDNAISGKSSAYRPITPNKLDKAVMEGLGNNSLTWTEAYKTSARNTIGAEAQATIQTLSATDSITLDDNTIYNGSTQTALTIALWSTPAVTSIAEVVFTSGTTATTLTYPNTIKWLGDDISANVFTPVASKRYTIIFYYDGVETVGVVKGVV